MLEIKYVLNLFAVVVVVLKLTAVSNSDFG
jgi:hypothetical protein